jgi:predicted enzyme related to lactoylglutathione lyase
VVELAHGNEVRAGAAEVRKYPSPGFFKVGFYVHDLPGVLTALSARGVTIEVPLFEEKDVGTRSAVINDVEGNAIQLFEFH